MRLIQKLIKNKTPFAVIKYNEWLVSQKDECSTAYEVVFLQRVLSKPYIADGIKQQDEFTTIIGEVMNDKNLKYFKEIKNQFNFVFENIDGAVWEMFNFKKEVNSKEVKY